MFNASFLRASSRLAPAAAASVAAAGACLVATSDDERRSNRVAGMMMAACDAKEGGDKTVMGMLNDIETKVCVVLLFRHADVWRRQMR